MGVCILGHLVSPNCQGYSLGLVSFSRRGLCLFRVWSEEENRGMTKDRDIEIRAYVIVGVGADAVTSASW